MARSTSEEEIRLRKRARRRLIGAIVLTTLVVVALPMVLDSEPRPVGDDIAVQIPSPNSGPYAPRGQPETGRAGSSTLDDASGTASAPLAAPAHSLQPAAAAAPAAARGPAPASPSATPADQKIQVVGALRSAPDAGAAAAGAEAGSTNAAAEAAAAARATAARAMDAVSDAAKPAPEIRSVPAKGPDAKGTPGDAEAKSFVIQLGAFAEVNRAKDRHAQLAKAGVKAYTEVIKTPTGDKTRVRAGPFPTREAAEQANERLKGLGLADGIVVPRRY
jgi:DedD protein